MSDNTLARRTCEIVAVSTHASSREYAMCELEKMDRHDRTFAQICVKNFLKLRSQKKAVVMHYLIVNSRFGSKLLAARLPRTPPA